MKISITNVPQADELSKVIATVEAVSIGHKSDSQIADYVGFTNRQGRYYRLASEILGLIDNKNNNASLTSLGKELVVLDDNNRLKKLRTILKKNELFSKIISLIEQYDTGINRNGILNFLSLNIDAAESTISRRLNTILSWLLDSGLIISYILEIENNEETIYRINEELDESDFLDPAKFKEGIYPSSYTNDELDIKESHMQVISLLRKKEQKKIVVPEFQRNQVWKQQQKSRFIESLILNIPVPPFYISQDLEGNMIIVDGLQRSTAIFEFFINEYKLVGLEALPDLNDKYFLDLDKELRARIEDRDLLLYIMKPTVPMSIVYDIFNRINSNGTPLTRQEIRNCIYIGPSTKLLSELAQEDLFKKAIDRGISSLRMKDREAILRFFAFVLFDYQKDYTGDLDDFLGKAMRRINRLSAVDLNTLKDRFNRVMEKTFEFFELNNFRIPTEGGRGRINVALMEAISVFFDRTSDEFLNRNKNSIIQKYYEVLLNDLEFVESIKSSTNSEKNVKVRFSKTFQILTNL